jgi:hypothetical protein
MMEIFIVMMAGFRPLYFDITSPDYDLKIHQYHRYLQLEDP